MTDPIPPTAEPNEPVREKSNGLAITALVLGCVGLFFCFFVVTGFLGIILGGIGVVFGIIAVVQLRKNSANSKGLAISGLVTTALAVVFGIITTAIFSTAVNNTVGTINSAIQTTFGAPSVQQSVSPLMSSPSVTQPIAQSSATWGQRYTWPDGLAVQVSAPKPYHPSSSAIGTGARYVAVEVTVVNGTQNTYTYNSIEFGPSSATFDGKPIDSITDSQNNVGTAPDTAVLPGKSLTTTWAFPVAATTGQLQMQFSEAIFGGNPAVFTGAA